jgi:hypothetical protein
MVDEGAIGVRRDNTNLPDGPDWPGLRHQLTTLADRFSLSHGAH